jgi:transposase
MSSDFSSIVRVGVDLAKNVVQVHAIDSAGRPLVTRQLPRAAFADWCAQLPSGCVVAMEATVGCHYWARELCRSGIDARLISPSFVTPYRMEGTGGKNDANDAEAICEAAGRPRMRFVRPKTPEQQSWLVVHHLRDGYVKDRSATVNRIKAILLEFGIAMSDRVTKLPTELDKVLTDPTSGLPPLAIEALEHCRRHLDLASEHVKWCDRQIARHVRIDEVAQRALSTLGVGPLGASALAATVGDCSQFQNGRQFSAWLGLVPRQYSSGATVRLGRITKRGDAYLRKLLVMGARSALIVAPKHTDPVSVWAVQLRERIGWAKASVALANKNARRLWRTLSAPLPIAASDGSQIAGHMSSSTGLSTASRSTRSTQGRRHAASIVLSPARPSSRRSAC